MGQHDPLDGYITDLELRANTARLPGPAEGPDLADEAGELAEMIARRDWTTTDPLGIGGLLADAYRVQQLIQQGAVTDTQLLESLLGAALAGLRHYARGGEYRLPAEYRLAFRELGLVIGLHAAERMWHEVNGAPRPPYISPEIHAQLQALMRHLALRDEIEVFWRDPAHRRPGSWSEHRDINEVMLATSLVLDGFLVLLSPE